MPELPEVEILVRQLRPLIRAKTIRRVHICRERVIRPSAVSDLQQLLPGSRFEALNRRGKYLLFDLRPKTRTGPVRLLGHLGMTGRMYLQPAGLAWPKHAAVVLELGTTDFIFEDTRYFGRFTLDISPLDGLGPEPLEEDFNPQAFRKALSRSAQPLKTKLLDQCVVAGLGNIYASEALFRAQLSPRRKARSLKSAEVHKLWKAIRLVLTRAIEAGSTVPLDFAGKNKTDNLFYYGRSDETPDYYEEGLRVYGREGKPCIRCASLIRRIIQTGRSTFYCPKCQR